MIIAGRYSLKGGATQIRIKYGHLLREIEDIIHGIDAHSHRTKQSEEKTMPGSMLYSPVSLNQDFKQKFAALGWKKYKISCEYPTTYYCDDYVPSAQAKGAFREMDFLKERLGVEVQFGKYAFMVYNVCAKMTIFKNHSIIDMGVEIVPVKNFADSMSTGVSYFEQFVWDLDSRGEADIDIPVLILGIDA